MLNMERRTELMKRIENLTEEQFEKLENEIELPVVDTPVFLGYDEVAVYYSQAFRSISNRTYAGKLVITTDRTVFLSEQKGFEVKHHNITSSRFTIFHFNKSYGKSL